MSPASAAIRVDRILTIVVLPAPLGPSREKMVPSATVRSTPSSTMWSPKDLRTALALIAGLAGLIVTGFLAFSDVMGGRGVRQRLAATHGGPSSPSRAPAAAPPGSLRTPPTPAAPPAARPAHRPAAPGLRAPDRPAPGIRSHRSPSTGHCSCRSRCGPFARQQLAIAGSGRDDPAWLQHR